MPLGRSWFHEELVLWPPGLCYLVLQAHPRSDSTNSRNIWIRGHRQGWLASGAARSALQSQADQDAEVWVWESSTAQRIPGGEHAESDNRVIAFLAESVHLKNLKNFVFVFFFLVP